MEWFVWHNEKLIDYWRGLPMLTHHFYLTIHHADIDPKVNFTEF